ncbi:MAG: HDOD domain-containing protein [Cyanobacteria bacterium]|nr:HDOD domain-containing protein [Cyanobacteriota bacterium]MDA1021630.1 HDOD domain-containing protein [Cyanobacteriota bacterium]
MFAQCFKHANSAASGSMRELKTIKEIVDLLGFGYIKKAALFVAAKSIIDDPNIWFESVFVAIAAEFLARKSGMDKIESDQVYMAGLFQNYGAFLLKTAYPNIYARVTAVDDFKLRMEREREEFGYTYPLVSALVLTNYGLPDKVIGIIKKQELVYTKGYQKENIYIEIARILSKIQAQKIDIGLIREHLGVEGIEAMVMNSGLNLVDINEKSLEDIKVIVSEFV